MQIDTKKQVINVQLRRLITLVVMIAAVISIVLLSKLPNTFLGLNKYHWAIVVGVLYVLTIVYDLYWEYSYFFFSDEGDFIVMRYFSLGYFNHKKHSIEIPKSEYASFVLKESGGGLKKKIVLRRFYKNAEAQYPAISLTLLDKVQYAELLLALDKLSKKK